MNWALYPTPQCLISFIDASASISGLGNKKKCGEERKTIKEIFIPDFELTVTVQEVDTELKKIILIIDFSTYLKESSSAEGNVSKENNSNDGVPSEEN